MARAPQQFTAVAFEEIVVGWDQLPSWRLLFQSPHLKELVSYLSNIASIRSPGCKDGFMLQTYSKYSYDSVLPRPIMKNKGDNLFC